MSETEPSQSTWEGIIAKDSAKMHLGHNYGNVQNISYANQKSPAEQLLESLSFPGMYRYQERPLDSHEGTYEWLFDESMAMHSCENCSHREECPGWRCREVIEHSEFLISAASKFRFWLRTSQDIFWISGKAGAGKSCLMKFLLDHESTSEILGEWTSQEITLAGFFFWAAGGDLEQSYTGLLRSLLHQICSSQPRLVEKFAAGVSKFQLGRPWTVSRLNEAFHKVLGDSAESGCFVFFIDGLDEFKGDTTGLLRALDTLNTSPNIKICVSSRPWNIFERKYGSRANKLYFRLHEVNRDDISAYVQDLLIVDLGMEGGKVDQRFDTIANAIIHKAEGVFLWANLVVRSLREAFENSWSMSEMLTLLEETPSELEDLIQGIFNRIHPLHREKAARTFWLLLECEKTLGGKLHLLWLSIFDRSDSDTLRPGDYSLPQPVLHEMVNDAELLARKWCGDLVHVVRHSTRESSQESNVYEKIYHSQFEDFVQFSHRTIKDFIDEELKDGSLAGLAGENFCPAFALCTTIKEVAQCVCTDVWAFMALFKELLGATNDVDTSKQALLVDLAESFDTAAQKMRGGHAHWTLGDQVFRDLVEWGGIGGHSQDLVDKSTEGALFMAYMLHRDGYGLFWLMFNSTSQDHSPQGIYLWLGAALLDKPYIRERDITANLGALAKLLRKGADPNGAMHVGSRGTSVWQQYLFEMHGINFWDCRGGCGDVLALLLQYGADPDVELDIDELYRFLEAPKRSLEVSRLISKAYQEVPGSALFGSSASHGFAISSGYRSENVTSPPIRHLAVPATAAFEVPSPNAKYRDYATGSDDVEELFPIIKAKLLAASKEKARKQQSEDEAAATWNYLNLRNMQRYLPF